MEPFTANDRISLGAVVKQKLILYKLTGTWLIAQLADGGLDTDKFELSATLAGTRSGPKADEILRRSLDILNEYGVVWSGKDGSNG